MRKMLLFIGSICLCHSLYSQSLKIETSIDTNTLLIGDQRILTMKVSVPQGKTVRMPSFVDTLMNKVEVLNQSSVDTISKDSRLMVLQKKCLITCFDSGTYNLRIGPFVIDKNDTMWANPIQMTVNTMKVDTAKGITDIKAPYDAPLEWAEIWLWLRWVLLGLLLVLIIGSIVLYLIFNRKKGIKENIIFEDPDIVALRELEKLHNEPFIKNEQYKQYYSLLSDIIRTYIEHRYNGIKAMETTSDIILKQCKHIQTIDNDLFDKLQQILTVSDLVKFAKYIPVSSENEMCYNNAIHFVEKTKIEHKVADQIENQN